MASLRKETGACLTLLSALESRRKWEIHPIVVPAKGRVR
jgi:hypothetical protein